MPFLTLRDLHRHRHVAAIERGLPLIDLAADEAEEVIEALHGGPAVERSGDARLPVGDVVVLADERGAVPTLPQNLSEHRRALGNLTAVAGIAVALLRDDAGARRMMIASGEQRCARRGAQGSGVEARVAQAHLRETIEI